MQRRQLVADPILKMTSPRTDVFDWLAGLEFFGVKLGLHQTQALFAELGSPEKDLKFIHIAGSNGKGSTGAFLEAGLLNAGFKTGFYSSPHLIEVNERFRINGAVPDSVTVARALEKVRTAAEKLQEKGFRVTYFEATTAAAALLFAEAGVDFVVWETGMGGRLDATNIVTPLASVITSLSLEHKEYLGDTLAKIAFEKAGIIKPGVPVFIGCTVPDEAMRVFTARSRELGAPLEHAVMPDDGRIVFEDDIPYQILWNGTVRLPLPGRFQRANAALARLVLLNLATRFGFDPQKALDGFRKTHWPARFQVFPHEKLLFDGAHNPECARGLADALREVYPGEKFDFIYGSFADKDTRAFLKELIPLAASFLFVSVESARKSRPPEELCTLLHELAPEIPCSATCLKDALAKPVPNRKVLCGSLHLCGEALALREQTGYRPSSF